jgi:hypothetical protein
MFFDAESYAHDAGNEATNLARKYAGGDTWHDYGATAGIAALAAMRDVIDAALRQEVAGARELDWATDAPAASWSEIGAALGVSKQAAAARYGKKPA